MRTIGNILWLVIAGFWTAIEWVIAGAILCLTVVGMTGVVTFRVPMSAVAQMEVPRR